MNPIGLDVAGLDVGAFLAHARVVFVVAALAFLAVARSRGPRFLLAGVLLGNAWVWAITNHPLQRLYALGPSQDRIGNLALVQVVAAGNSPLRTPQVGQLHFEPFWGLLVAALSGFDPDRVLALYPFLSLLIVSAFALSLYRGLAPKGSSHGASGLEADPPWSPWERALVAGFGTLLACVPLDFTGTYRAPWAMTFLLKPNHALGLVLFPVFIRLFVSIRNWRGRLAAGLVLHLLGWVFVLHMAYVCVGLVTFAALSLVGRRPDARRDVLDVAAVIGVNLLVVSPYLVMLVVGYPFLDPNPRATLFVASPHLLETTLRHGPVFLLGAWGALIAYRRGDRLGRVFSAQVLAAHLVWVAYLGLHFVQMAREKDEIFYWSRFLTATAAGIGAWDLARRAAGALSWNLTPAVRAAAIGLVALPWSLPAWWDPLRMDAYFAGSVAPLPQAIERPMEFLRHQTGRKAVVAGDRDLAKWVAALGARRVVLTPILHNPKDYSERAQVEDVLLRERDGDVVRAAAAHYGVTHLLVTPSLLAPVPGLTLETLRSRPHYNLVHLSGPPRDFVAIFELR